MAIKVNAHILYMSLIYLIDASWKSLFNSNFSLENGNDDPKTVFHNGKNGQSYHSDVVFRSETQMRGLTISLWVTLRVLDVTSYSISK